MAANSWSVEGVTVLASFRNGAEQHGYAVVNKTGFSVPTVYNAIHRFEQRGLLARRQERVDQTVAPRVARVFYKITTGGLDQLVALGLALGLSS